MVDVWVGNRKDILEHLLHHGSDAYTCRIEMLANGNSLDSCPLSMLRYQRHYRKYSCIREESIILYDYR